MTQEYLHYKDKNPSETIKLIQNFFNQQNFDIKLIEDESEIKTFYCKLDLYYKGMYIFSSGGKGITKDYALASGYAELYERFCNKTFLLNSLLVNKKIKELNLKHITVNYNYSFLQQYGKYMFNNDLSMFKKYIDFLIEDTCQPDTFQHINLSNEQIILDNRIMFKITGSTGMCAGNSFEEAFNQGMSEIYERWCHRQFLLKPPNIFYQLSDNFLSTLKIFPYIKKLKELGYKTYIFDLGYNYNAPVILTFIININKKNIYYNLGAFPDINIAIERTLTETYQGIKSYNDIDKLEPQIPFKATTPIEILKKNAASTLKYFCIDESIFNKIKKVDQSSQAFINSNLTNKEIFNFFQELNKQHNFNIYYQNNSLIKDIYALYIICPEILEAQYQGIENTTIENTIIFDILKNYKNLLNSLLEGTLDYSLIHILNLQKYQIYQNKINILLYGDCFNFYSTAINNKTFSDLLILLSNYTNLNKIKNKIFNTLTTEIYQKEFIKFIFIQDYLNANYSPLEILNLNIIFDQNNLITIDDINNAKNATYLFKHIFMLSFQNYFYSNDYQEVISNLYKQGRIK